MEMLVCCVGIAAAYFKHLNRFNIKKRLANIVPWDKNASNTPAKHD